MVFEHVLCFSVYGSHTSGAWILCIGVFIAYGPVRLMMDFVRPESTDVRYLGFTPAQYFVVGFMTVALVLLMRRLKSGDEPVWAPLKGTDKAA